MVKKLTKILTISIIIFLILNCSKKNTRLILDEDGYYKKIIKEFENKNYNDFQEDAEYFLSDYQGSDKVPYIQFLLGESYFNEEDFAEAIAEYNRVIYKYPDSEYIDDSYYKIGVSYYKQRLHPQRDQTNTKKAIYYLNKSMELSSEFNTKAEEMISKCRNILAKKRYFRAEFYFKRDNYDVSINILNDAIDEYSNTDLIDNFYYLLSYNYLEKKDKDKAMAFIKKAINENTGKNDFKEEMEELKEKIKSIR